MGAVATRVAIPGRSVDWRPAFVPSWNAEKVLATKLTRSFLHASLEYMGCSALEDIDLHKQENAHSCVVSELFRIL